MLKKIIERNANDEMFLFVFLLNGNPEEETAAFFGLTFNPDFTAVFLNKLFTN